MVETPLFFLAEDDLDDQELFIEALRLIDRNIHCITAFNGEEAIQKLLVLDNRPDFIFLDINLPLFNGFQCLTEIKQNPTLKEVPTIMYTTFCSKKDMMKAQKLGAYETIQKPYSPSDLSSYLRGLLSN